MTRTLAAIAVFIVAALHGGFLALEMFLWEAEAGRSVTGYTAEEAAFTSVLAANQGLYNGFIAAGLLWGLIAGKRDVKIFFLICVVIAGLYGAWSAASPTILYLQAIPGALALALTLFAGKARRGTKIEL
ncbi:DUF1304 domain-containing protein [Hyphococcus flavus]|uniref:DUF1304 domain-containing protein n=1 Tax=Hyphococcus flavus TaxID=1866326 RepID=A0AAF0CEE5_9PROT|nr:DUF1304 domain-containing protein [Hyphococcus flavus]WDI30044.1 DUF1304 domain-containing protein [Hyphococcus flavus]